MELVNWGYIMSYQTASYGLATANLQIFHDFPTKSHDYTQ